MQTPLDPSFLFSIPWVAFFFVALIWLFVSKLTRTRGIHGSFTNEDEGVQIATEAEISAEGISNSFKNAKKAKQDLGKAKITCDSKKTADQERNLFLKMLDLLIAYFVGRPKYGARHGNKKE